jgi:Family of unknown function (DUF6496)
MMSAKRTLQRARKDKAQGKSLSAQAGEFVREEIHHVREGKHGARNAKQAIAIGLSKARRAGVKLRPNASNTSPATRHKAAREMARVGHKPSGKRARSSKRALERESHSAASTSALARQAHSSASRRGRQARVAAAQKAARTRRRRRKPKAN